MINGHGDDIYSQVNKVVSNFSSNMYSRQDMSELDNHLREHIQLIHSYPEPDAASLVHLLADRNGLKASRILVTNGATEAIYLIAQAFQGAKSAVVYPTFSEYADASAINRHTLSWVSSLAEVSDDVDLLWLCNPNNPTGAVTDKEVLKEFIESHPSLTIVIDQSYESFTTKPLFRAEEAVQYKNVILLHSMTKQYAIPGLRLGYITACADLVQKIRFYCMPWAVNALAVEAGKFLMTKKTEIIDISTYLEKTKRLQQALREIEGVEVLDTDTHFFLCKLKAGKASDLKCFLLEEYGILIRDAANFRGLDESYFRIATQSTEENNFLIKAVKKWVTEI